jgi:hypothetical protein
MRTISLVVVLACVAAAPAADVQVKLLRGSDVKGQLVAVSSDKLTLATATGERAIPANELRSVEFPQTRNELEKPRVWLQLLDGSQIAGTSVSLATGKAVVELVGGDKLPEMPARAIRAIRFSTEPKLTEPWNEILAATRSGDLLVLKKSATRDVEEGGVTKTVTTLTLDELEGTVLQVGPDSVKFDFDGDKVDVKREKLEGIIFFQPVKRELPPAVVRLKDLADSDWQLRTVELQGDELVATTPAGATLRLSLTQIKRLDFSAGNEALLAELPIETSEASTALLPKGLSPAAAEWFGPAVGKRPGVAVVRGSTPVTTTVGLTGESSVTYRVPEGFKKFAAEVLLVSKVGTGSDVEVVVLGDGKPLVKHLLAATGERLPLPIEVDVVGVRRLTLQATSASQGLGALVDFQEARFTK